MTYQSGPFRNVNQRSMVYTELHNGCRGVGGSSGDNR